MPTDIKIPALPAPTPVPQSPMSPLKQHMNQPMPDPGPLPTPVPTPDPTPSLTPELTPTTSTTYPPEPPECTCSDFEAGMQCHYGEKCCCGECVRSIQ